MKPERRSPELDVIILSALRLPLQASKSRHHGRSRGEPMAVAVFPLSEHDNMRSPGRRKIFIAGRTVPGIQNCLYSAFEKA